MRVEEASISLNLLCPGFIETEIRAVDNRGVFHEGQVDRVQDFLVMSSERAATQMVNAVEKRNVSLLSFGTQSWEFCWSDGFLLYVLFVEASALNFCHA